jgi:Spy/CpxP family protein refolding chaperone
MRKYFLVGSLLLSLGASGVVMSAETERGRAAVPEELSDAWERFQRSLQEWSGRIWERFGSRDSRESRPAISQILSSKEALGLSTEQTRKLEQLRDDFQRLSIRSDADLRIVELDIAAALENEPVEMAKLEAKMREAEKLRTDLRIARIRAIEHAKALLTVEQKKKFQETNRQTLAPRPPRFGQNPPATEREPPFR